MLAELIWIWWGTQAQPVSLYARFYIQIYVTNYNTILINPFTVTFISMKLGHMCMLNHWLDWDKWVLTNFDHNRQWFNKLIPPLHESAAVTVDNISRLIGPVRLILRYTMVDIYCRDRRYEWDGGIKLHIISWFSICWYHTVWNFSA